MKVEQLNNIKLKTNYEKQLSTHKNNKRNWITYLFWYNWGSNTNWWSSPSLLDEFFGWNGLKMDLNDNGSNEGQNRREIVTYVRKINVRKEVMIQRTLVQKEEKDTLYLMRLLRYPLSKKTRWHFWNYFDLRMRLFE